MDIEYLLLLQKLRMMLDGVLDPFLETLSYLVISSYSYLIMAAIYWCIDKKAGAMLLFNLSGGKVLNQTVKNTCCIYRPWIRDSRIVPVGDSIHTATGYSFPSGHTQIATAQFESIAVWQRKRKWLVVLCMLVVFLVMFSRNYLGVHTPQDVVVSFLMCSFVVFLNGYIIKWVNKSPNNDWIMLGIGTVLCIGFLLYITYKPYPIDYAADGSILVEPFKMMTDCYLAAGEYLGFLLGWTLERHFIKFEEKVSVPMRLGRFAIGGIILYLFGKFAKAPLISVLGAHWGIFTYLFCVMMFIMVLYPLVFHKITGKTQE